MERIGPYQIVNEIGRGGMGVVYCAVDAHIRRRVAVKIIRLGDLSDTEEEEQLRARLFREAHAAGILKHTGIVTIYHVGEEDGVAFIAMEYVNGPTLEKLLLAGVPLAKERIRQILCESAAALDYAHKKGIVHRDVKPANIMLEDNETVKICDFGIAKGFASSTSVTQAGMVLGTPHYMPPEQIQGNIVDARADQYALAVIAFQMLTGRRPFQADSIHTLFYRILQEPPEAAHKLNPTLPLAVDAVLAKALAKDPGSRFPTCGQFVAELLKTCDECPDWTPLPRKGIAGMAATADRGAQPAPSTIAPEPSPSPAPSPPVAEPAMAPPPGPSPAPVSAPAPPVSANLEPLPTVAVPAKPEEPAVMKEPAPPVRPQGPVLAVPGTPTETALPKGLRIPRPVLLACAFIALALGLLWLVVARTGRLQILEFTADGQAVAPAQAVVLKWSVSGAKVCRITPGIGQVPSVGKTTVHPDASTTYTLDVTGKDRGLTARVTVNVVKPVPVVAPAQQGKTSPAQARDLLTRGFYDKAIVAYRAILAADAGNRQAQTGLAEAQAAKTAEMSLSGGGGESRGDALEKAQRLYANGEYAAAIAAFEQVLATHPRSARAKKGLAAAKAAAEAEKTVQ